MTLVDVDLEECYQRELAMALLTHIVVIRRHVVQISEIQIEVTWVLVAWW